MLRKLNHAGMALFVFLSLSAVILWMTGNLRIGPAATVVATGDEREGDHDEEAEEKREEHNDDAGTGRTDLEDLEKRECEHGVRMVDCEACRFELGVVKLNPSIAKALISTGSVEQRVAANAIRVTGEIQLDPTRVVEVPPLAAGRVTAVKAFLGEKVKRGDALTVIHSSDFGEAKATFLEAHAKLQLARTTLDREEGLFAKKISSEADYLSARQEVESAEARFAAAEKRLHLFGLDETQVEAVRAEKTNGHFAELIVRAPRDGMIVKQNVSEGKVVDGSESLYTIADLSNLWVWCDIYERDLARVHEGLAGRETLEAALKVAAFRDRTFPGTVDLIGSEIDEHTRTIKVRVQVGNPELRLRPGMFVDVLIAVPTRGSRTVVPTGAVLSDEGRRFVFQHWRDDLWVRRDVRVGEALGPYVEILDGVAAGAKVVTAGAFLLKSDVLRGKMGAGCAD